MIAGKPIIQTFTSIDNCHLYTAIDLTEADVALRQVAVALLKPIHQDFGVGVYYSLNTKGQPPSEWQYMGKVDNGRPTDFFRLSSMIEKYADKLHTMTLYIGLNLETLQDLAEHITSENLDHSRALSSSKAIAMDLYKFLSSFDGKIPNNVFDRWYQRFETRHSKEPFFWMNSKDWMG